MSPTPGLVRADAAPTSASWIMPGLAWLLLSSTLAAALHDMSWAWDVWYYHLPFAARLGGILPSSEYVFNAGNQNRFDGFPLLAELLQGVLWRVTGHAESANLVAYLSLPLFALWFRRRFHVPLHLTILGLLAVPLIQIHLTSCYVDLPANAALAALVLLTVEAHASHSPVSPPSLCVAALAAAVAVNMKALLQPLVLVALLALAWRALPDLLRDVRSSPRTGAKVDGDSPGAPRRRAILVVGCAFVALPLIFATPLKNQLIHHNPYYPVEVRVFGHLFPGPDTPYSSSPRWLEHAPRPFRFACSVFELGVRSYSDRRRWTVDQWTPPDADGYRMGGFFGLYAASQLALLAWRVLRERTRVVRVAGVAFALLTAVVSVMPQSHELRYYLVWMIVLVATNLWLAFRPAAGLPGLRPVLRAVSVASMLVVLAVTRCGYAYPAGSTFAEVIRAVTDDRALASVRDGERICVHKEPWNVAWAAAFHPPRHYVVKEAEHAEECAGYRALD